jgi:hypothetical protein
VTDTLRFNTDPTATDFEERDLLIKYLKLGLTPYIVKAGNGNDIAIQMKTKTDEKKKDTSTTTKDPWNYWVFRVGANGNISADEVYKTSRFGGNLAANRVTEELKVGFEASGSKNRDSYYLEDSTGKQKIVNKNEDYNFQHYLITSISDHWSYGYQVELSRSSFFEIIKAGYFFVQGFEYDIYPYKEVNTKFFTLSYTVDVRRNSYFDTTLYDKLKRLFMDKV